MHLRDRLLLMSVPLIVLPASLSAQTFRSADSVIRKMWQVGIEQSQTEKLAQVLADSIGPRLSGSPGFQSAVDWIERTYNGWGVPVRREKYGTWRGWRMGTVHMEMIAPRMQNLEVELLAWSPSTPKNGPVEGDVVVIPELADSAAVRQWLGTLRGKFVLVSAPELMCRAPQELERYARRETITRLNTQRVEVQRAATARFRALAPGAQPQDVNRIVYGKLDSAGVAGVGTTNWSNGWGVNKIFGVEHEPGAERGPLVRGLRAAPSPGDEQAGPARSPDGGIAVHAGRGADVQRRRRAQGDGAA